MNNEKHSDKIAEHVKNMKKSGIREFFDLAIGCDDVRELMNQTFALRSWRKRLLKRH